MIDLNYRGWRFDVEARCLQKMDRGGWATHTDYPVYYPTSDKVAFDRPECVPSRVQAKVLKIMRDRAR